jgi:hypothetical protein
MNHYGTAARVRLGFPADSSHSNSRRQRELPDMADGARDLERVL